MGASRVGSVTGGQDYCALAIRPATTAAPLYLQAGAHSCRPPSPRARVPHRVCVGHAGHVSCVGLQPLHERAVRVLEHLQVHAAVRGATDGGNRGARLRLSLATPARNVASRARRRCTSWSICWQSRPRKGSNSGQSRAAPSSRSAPTGRPFDSRKQSSDDGPHLHSAAVVPHHDLPLPVVEADAADLGRRVRVVVQQRACARGRIARHQNSRRR